jgi:hypothetical protein
VPLIGAQGRQSRMKLRAVVQEAKLPRVRQSHRQSQFKFHDFFGQPCGSILLEYCMSSILFVVAKLTVELQNVHLLSIVNSSQKVAIKFELVVLKTL